MLTNESQHYIYYSSFMNIFFKQTPLEYREHYLYQFILITKTDMKLTD